MVDAVDRWKYAFGSIFLLSLSVAYTAAAPAEEAQILVDDGRVQVSRADFEARLATFPAPAQSAVRADPDKVTSVLESIYLQRALARQAEDAGLAQQPQYAAQIRQASDSILAKAWLGKLIASEAAPDFEPLAEEQYRIQKDKYRTPEQVRIAHILIKTDGRGDEDAKELAETVRTKALQEETNFEKLAVEYSEDPSVRRNRGNLGIVTRGKMVPEFERVAFSMTKPGEISPVVKSQFGYHVIKLLNRVEAGQRSFEEVKDEIIAGLKRTHDAGVRARLLSELRANDSIQLNKAAIENLVTPTPR